jgi:hypothetical protein
VHVAATRQSQCHDSAASTALPTNAMAAHNLRLEAESSDVAQERKECCV